METILEYLPVALYLLLYGGLKLSEHVVLARAGRRIRKGWGDWTVWLILVPMWLVLMGPLAEFFLLHTRPSIWEVTSGVLLFLAAGFFSVKGYLDLQRGFADAVAVDDTGLVVTGLYHTIRHPVTLGNILFCIACPLLLAAGPSWIPALTGILGMLLRISIEESFMAQHVSDYEEYKERTWAMIPYIY